MDASTRRCGSWIGRARQRNRRAGRPGLRSSIAWRRWIASCSMRRAAKSTPRAAPLAEAETELAPFAARMPADARARAIDAAFDRLLRDFVGLPTLSHEP